MRESIVERNPTSATIVLRHLDGNLPFQSIKGFTQEQIHINVKLVPNHLANRQISKDMREFMLKNPHLLAKFVSSLSNKRFTCRHETVHTGHSAHKVLIGKSKN